MKNQVVDLLANIRFELEEGFVACFPTSNPSHSTIITCRNITNTKYRPSDGVLPEIIKRPSHGEATWPSYQLLSPQLVPSHRLHHLVDVITLSPPYIPLMQAFTRTSWKLWNAGNFMALRADFPWSLPPLLTSIPLTLLKTSFLAPDHSSHNSPPLWCILHSDLRLERPPMALDMPHLIGKAKRGVAWYEAKGQNLPTPTILLRLIFPHSNLHLMSPSTSIIM